MKEANRDAAMQIFEKVNALKLPENLLDLHGLHVDEALAHLGRVLQEKTEGTRTLLCLQRLNWTCVCGQHLGSRTFWFPNAKNPEINAFIFE